MAKAEKTTAVLLSLTLDEAEAVYAVMSLCGEDRWTGGIFDALQEVLNNTGKDFTAKWDTASKAIVVTEE